MSKIYKVQWTSNAKEDLLNIVTYIKEDSSTIARDVYEKIKEKAHSSNLFPLRSRVIPELQKEGITMYRELISYLQSLPRILRLPRQRRRKQKDLINIVRSKSRV